MNAYANAQAQQRAAAAPETNVFVTANAGSGKTKVLVDRIARLLLDGAKPSAFLCITYTKAAAAEMQRRLFRQLGDWCVASDETLRETLRDLRGADPRDEELPRARALFAQALETPGGLRIQTIHAFCERLLARFPLEAGAPPGFEIADEARAAALMRAAQASICASDNETVSAAFAHFATRLHADALDMLLATLAARGDRGPPPHTSTDEPEDVIARALAATPWDDLMRAAGILGASGVQDQDRADSIRAACGARADPTKCWQALMALHYTDGGKPRAKLITATLAKKYPDVEALLLREAGRTETARAALRAAERAADARAAFVLALALSRAYAAEKERAGILDFEDLIKRAHTLLSASHAAPWVLYKLDGGIAHILIDEGQDTSPEQWNLIAPLQNEFFAGEGALEKRRTVFAVGDPKQSIYSFQGADPQRFLNENRELESRALAAGAAFEAPVLEMSFRSSPEILQAVDATFEGVDLALGEPEKFNIVRHVARRAEEGGRVEVWPITPRPKQNESRAWDAPLDMESGINAQSLLARALAKRVRTWIDEGEAVWDRGVRRAMRAGDVLALVQKRGPVFHALIRAFKREGLEVAGADRMVLRDELAVEDCLALIRVALDPGDDLSLACVLKGPWLNLTNDDTDLFPLAHDRRGKSLHERLMASDDLNYAEARTFIAKLTQKSGEDAFSLLSWALENPHGTGATGWARVLGRLGHEARDPVEELLERALKPGPRAAPTLQRFLAEIDADIVQVKRELETVDNAIRVMTVHGAKGLEAPVVLLPDTTNAVNTRAENGLLFGADGVAWSPRVAEDDEIAARARAEQEERARGEHWRLLYVAMTRARDRLIVAGFGRGQGEGRAENGCWHTQVWEALAPHAQKIQSPFGEGLALGESVQVDRALIHAEAPVVIPDWAKKTLPSQARPRAAPSRMKDPAALSPRRDAHVRFRRGRLIHGLLERLPDLARELRANAGKAWLARQGMTDEGDVQALIAEALAVIEGAAFAAVFGPQSRAEAPLVGDVSGRRVSGVIDRLVVTPDEILVLDFKSDRPAPEAAEDAPESYVLQMAFYRAVLSQIFPDRPVRCALVWTEKPVLTELSAAQLNAALTRHFNG